MASVYDQNRKGIFGEYLKTFFVDSDLWPEELVQWFDDMQSNLTPMAKSRGLTVELLLQYLSEKTGMDFITKPYYKSLLGNWSRWATEPGRGGDNTALMLALAECEIVYIDDYLFSELRDLVLWLQGYDLPQQPSGN